MLEKKCRKCETIKDISDFGKKHSNKDGLRSYCRSCLVKLRVSYARTKKGLCFKIYATQTRSSKQRGHTLQTYTRDELKEWLFSQKKFHLLYDNWKRLDYQKEYIPSVDRKDDYVGYTMANIQLMTWQENNKKHYKDRKSGKTNKINKAVVCIAKTGHITEYFSMHEAERQTGVARQDIGKVCLGKRNHAGGFMWKYKDLLNGKQ